MCVQRKVQEGKQHCGLCERGHEKNIPYRPSHVKIWHEKKKKTKWQLCQNRERATIGPLLESNAAKALAGVYFSAPHLSLSQSAPGFDTQAGMSARGNSIAGRVGGF